jgi:hypothetical protein
LFCFGRLSGLLPPPPSSYYGTLLTFSVSFFSVCCKKCVILTINAPLILKMRDNIFFLRANYRVDRVLSFFSSHWNWNFSTPSPAAAGECAYPPPPLGSGGRGTLACGRWGGESQPNEGAYTYGTGKVLQLYMYFVGWTRLDYSNKKCYVTSVLSRSATTWMRSVIGPWTWPSWSGQ